MLGYSYTEVPVRFWSLDFNIIFKFAEKMQWQGRTICEGPYQEHHHLAVAD